MRLSVVGNSLYINDRFIKWCDLKYLETVGTYDMSLTEKFEYLLDCRLKGKQPVLVTDVKSLEQDDSSDILCFGEAILMLNSQLDKLADNYYHKYKRCTSVSKEDIKQELILVALELYNDPYLTRGAITKKNIKSYFYFIRRKFDGRRHMVFNNYSYCTYSPGRLEQIIDFKNAASKDSELYNKEYLKEKLDLLNYQATDLIVDSLSIEPILDIDNLDIEDDNNEILNLENKLLIDQLNEYVEGSLFNRELQVIKMRFGYVGRAYTLDEVAKEFNITKERARQIEAKALRKLRLRKHMILDHDDMVSILGK